MVRSKTLGKKRPKEVREVTSKKSFGLSLQEGVVVCLAGKERVEEQHV